MRALDPIALTASVTSIIGAVLVARKSVLGFYLWLVSNVIWLIVDVMIGLWEQVPIWLAFTATSAYGIINWKPKAVSA